MSWQVVGSQYKPGRPINLILMYDKTDVIGSDAGTKEPAKQFVHGGWFHVLDGTEMVLSETIGAERMKGKLYPLPSDWERYVPHVELIRGWWEHGSSNAMLVSIVRIQVAGETWWSVAKSGFDTSQQRVVRSVGVNQISVFEDQKAAEKKAQEYTAEVDKKIELSVSTHAKWMQTGVMGSDWVPLLRQWITSAGSEIDERVKKEAARPITGLSNQEFGRAFQARMAARRVAVKRATRRSGHGD